MPFGSGKVSPCSLSAVRMRYSKAAYTRRHSVITLKNAMTCCGFLRERDVAQTARVCAEATFGLHWSCGAGSHLLGRQATVVELMGDEDDATVLVDEGLPGCAP